MKIIIRKKIIQFQNKLNTWRCRKLSLKGKVTILNSVGYSPFLYLMSMIHTPDKVFKEIKSITFKFLWDGGLPKIAHSTLILPISQGGLNLIDLECKSKALKLNWIPKLCSIEDANWKEIPKLWFNTDDFNNV